MSGELRMFCFPYAGGSATRVYGDWHRDLPAPVDVVPMEIPGRGARIVEQPVGSVAELVDDALPRLLPAIDRPFILFGHSLGAMVAFELAGRLVERYDLVPALLCLSGLSAPTPRQPDLDYLLPDQEFRARLRQLGGTPHEILDDDDLMEVLLPVLRADFGAADRYLPADRDPLPCPLSVFGGVDDPEAPPTTLAGWRHRTSRRFESRVFPGDHFFLHGARSAVLAALGRDLAELAAAPVPTSETAS